MADPPKLLLAVGSGLEITVPAGVTLLPIDKTVEAGLPIGALQQQEIVRAAIEKPADGPALSELARSHRRVAIMVGDLSLPAPYDIALPPIISALVEGGIRPTRTAVLACPGDSGPVLGRAAIHRYGEEIVGDHELRAWKGGENGAPDPLYAAADLRIAIAPSALPPELKSDVCVQLQFGRKARIDIVACVASKEWRLARDSQKQNVAPVAMTSGGGGDWESTLEEALLSLWQFSESETAVLTLSGDEGLGSAHFTRDLWSLLEQAEEFLTGGGNLAGSTPRPERFDPAAVLAYALSAHAHLVFFAPKLAEHSEGEEFVERLNALPNLSQRMGLIGRETDMWALLERWHGKNYRLVVNPLGWRAQ